MKVRLRELMDQARELVRTGSYDQAIATCRYILKQHPKYIDAYRVVAEACLERGDYKEATDLFKRVLSAAPHNFIAYVGLGIIYEQDGLLDEAIWHLERAFELAPANGEIRQMLRQLYEKRDGVEPSRLKLNRAALGYLYTKGGLYPEAVNEFQQVLTQDPERIDIQLAMAEAYWHADNRRESAELCQEILNKMPNCLKANLLLGKIWSSTGLEDEGETLLRRARSMDPEGLIAQEVLEEQSPLQVEEVWIEQPEQLEEEVAALESIDRALLTAPQEAAPQEEVPSEAEPEGQAKAIEEMEATEAEVAAASLTEKTISVEDKLFMLDNVEAR